MNDLEIAKKMGDEYYTNEMAKTLKEPFVEKANTYFVNAITKKIFPNNPLQGYIKKSDKETISIRIINGECRAFMITEISEDIYISRVVDFTELGCHLKYFLTKDNKVISEAHVNGWYDDDDLLLSRVFTVEQERKKGYATLLINFIIKEIKQFLSKYNIEIFKSVYLHVGGDKDVNTNFRYKFYEKFGFEVEKIPYMRLKF